MTLSHASDWVKPPDCKERTAHYGVLSDAHQDTNLHFGKTKQKKSQGNSRQLKSSTHVLKRANGMIQVITKFAVRHHFWTKHSLQPRAKFTQN